METSCIFHRWICALCVLTVPMRNGNVVYAGMYYGLYVFLPYLWGMETSFSIHRTLALSFRSYRTYEEWKRTSLRVSRIVYNDGSYRTYEEWKPVTPSSYKTSKSGSYRTYEEWKLYDIVKAYQLISAFLPYLWGMETTLVKSVITYRRRFLPYLWGMETSAYHHRFVRTCQFLPYLWGMETGQIFLDTS